jgi:hypothetical protein
MKLDELESWKLTAEDLAKESSDAHKILNKNNIPKHDSNGDELTLNERINWFLAPTKKKKGKFSDVLTMVVSVYGDGSSEESAQKQARYNLFELISIIRRMKNVWDIVGVDCDLSCMSKEKEK